MKTMLLCAALALAAGQVAADENAFLLTGRISLVLIENPPFEPQRVRIFVNVFVPGDNGAPGSFRVVDTICAPSQWFFCKNVNYMLGSPCGIIHDQVPMTDFHGGVFFNDRYQCASPHAANCMSINGVNSPERRGDGYVPGNGCQF